MNKLKEIIEKQKAEFDQEFQGWESISNPINILFATGGEKTIEYKKSSTTGQVIADRVKLKAFLNQSLQDLDLHWRKRVEVAIKKVKECSYGERPNYEERGTHFEYDEDIEKVLSDILTDK
jgi:hypothetical protein